MLGLRPTTSSPSPLTRSPLSNMRESIETFFSVFAVVARARCTFVRTRDNVMLFDLPVMHRVTKVLTRVRRSRPITHHCGVSFISLSPLSLRISFADTCFFRVPCIVSHSLLYLGRSVRLRDGTRAEPRGGRGDGPSRLGGCFSRVSATCCCPPTERAVRIQI